MPPRIGRQRGSSAREGTVMKDTTELQEIDRSRREAALWCEIAVRNSQLRTAALKPSLAERMTRDEIGVAVRTLVRTRRELLAT